MATKKQIAAVAKQQAVVDKKIADLKKSTGVAVANMGSNFLSDVGFQGASTQAKKVDPVAEAKAALDAAAKSGDSQKYQDALSKYRTTSTTQILGNKPEERVGFTIQRVGNEWRYISTSTGGGGPQITLPLGDDETKKDDKNKPTTGSPTSTQLDSIAAIKALLSSYGIGDLTDAITNSVIKGYSSDTIQLIMQDPNSADPLAVAFQKRFPANKARIAAGKSVLSPGEYLAAERTYTQVLQSYGVASMASKEKLSQFISNDISAAEVADRVGLAINRVKNADPETKKMLAQYYPMLNQSDIVSAVLDPAEGLPALQRKVQISEIGGAALAQGLTTGIKAASDLKTAYSIVTSGSLGAEDLANLGVTKEQARAGYQQVAETAPRGEFLSSITGGEDYTRLQAEQEAFQGLASAKRARVNLTQSELARFGGSSGMSKASLSKGKQGSF